MNYSFSTLELKTRQPFGIARWTFSHYPRSFVQVGVENTRIYGRGEAAPNAFYGETRATVEAVLPDLLERMNHLDIWDWQGLETLLSTAFPHGHPSVKCALEMAVLETCALSVNLPVWKVLGLSPSPIPESSFTVSLAPLKTMRDNAARAILEGYTILKVKLGTAQDISILETLREAAPKAKIRVDANAAWTRAQAKKMLGVLEQMDVELLEQPLAADDLEGHLELRRLAKITIFADESLHSRSSLPGLDGAFDGVNLKLQKLGGPLQALHTLRTARALGLSVMLGCMIESSLGIAASAHLAGLADFTDLDGATLLENDPFAGLVWNAGMLERPTGAGWGVQRLE